MKLSCRSTHQLKHRTNKYALIQNNPQTRHIQRVRFECYIFVEQQWSLLEKMVITAD